MVKRETEKRVPKFPMEQALRGSFSGFLFFVFILPFTAESTGLREQERRPAFYCGLLFVGCFIRPCQFDPAIHDTLKYCPNI